MEVGESYLIKAWISETLILWTTFFIYRISIIAHLVEMKGSLINKFKIILYLSAQSVRVRLISDIGEEVGL